MILSKSGRKGNEMGFLCMLVYLYLVKIDSLLLFVSKKIDFCCYLYCVIKLLYY